MTSEDVRALIEELDSIRRSSVFREYMVEEDGDAIARAIVALKASAVSAHANCDYGEGWEEGFKAGAAQAVSTPSTITDANQIRAEAVREATRYLERIHKRGLRNRDDMLADLEAVAIRMEQGMTARGNVRVAAALHPGGETNGN